MAARTRQVVWGESAQRALDEILGDIAEGSPAGADRVLRRALETADSLSTLSERGRVVPEIGESTLRELFVLSSLEESADDVAAAWATELEQRSRDVAEGRVQTVAWEAARTDILKELEERRASRSPS